jgi:FkbM family methyltransferase
MNRFCSALLYRSKMALSSDAVVAAKRNSRVVSVLIDSAKSGARALLGDRLRWVQVRDGPAKGAWLHLRLPTESGYWLASHEPDVQQSIARFLKPGQVAYDIGAHVGFCTAVMAMLTGSEGCVVAFDGDAENVSRILEQVQRNGWTGRVRVEHRAIWSQSLPTIPFRRGGTLTSRGGVETVSISPVLGTGELVDVPAISLDHYVRAGAPQPELIKVDVEGAEAEVLRGATRLAMTKRPVLIVEVHHARAAADITDWLQISSYNSEWHIPPQEYPRRLIAVAR